MSLLWLVERIFEILLPPASREHIVGDFHEKFHSAGRYAKEALAVLGPLVVSRIRRTTDFQVCLMEALAIYSSFSAAALWLGQNLAAQLAIPTIVSVAALLICNAYADPLKPLTIWRPVLQSVGSLAFAFLGQAVVLDTNPSLAIPLPVMVLGSCLSVAFVSMLRILFPHGLRTLALYQGVGPVREKPRSNRAAMYFAAIAIAVIIALISWYRDATILK